MNQSFPLELMPFLKGTALKRGAIFGTILAGALVAFEVFNFSTTQFALIDMLGDLKFVGIRWASILAVAFCGIDFAGIARLFTPEQGRDEPAEVWYLFAAWMLAAGFNATLTWWGVSVAIIHHQSAGSGTLLSASFLVKGVPVFVALMVWLIRVLIISTFSIAGERLFTLAEEHTTRSESVRPQPQPQPRPVANPVPAPVYVRPTPKPAPAPAAIRTPPLPRPEPAYHPVGMTASSANESNSTWR